MSSQQQPQHSTPSPTDEDPAAALYEQTHVHKVYSQIAPHFSATRHKPWPLVSHFLLSQPPGSVGLDVGCGNGKYLSVNPHVYLVGSDRSEELVSLASKGGREAMTADGLALPFRGGCADFVISVAVVHHFSTRERRVGGIRALLACIRPGRRKGGGDGGGGATVEGGKVLVYVWALEQGSSRRGWDEGAAQDQLVPWVMKSQQQRQGRRKEKKAELSGSGATSCGEGVGRSGEGDAKEEEERTFQRYYHLYRKGELEEDVMAAGGLVLESGYERDNWWVIAANVVS
jgi:tRNA (uracil-5-)-methyltransferase TRM9